MRFLEHRCVEIDLWEENDRRFYVEAIEIVIVDHGHAIAVVVVLENYLRRVRGRPVRDHDLAPVDAGEIVVVKEIAVGVGVSRIRAVGRDLALGVDGGDLVLDRRLLLGLRVVVVKAGHVKIFAIGIAIRPLGVCPKGNDPKELERRTIVKIVKRIQRIEKRIRWMRKT